MIRQWSHIDRGFKRKKNKSWQQIDVRSTLLVMFFLFRVIVCKCVAQLCVLFCGNWPPQIQLTAIELLSVPRRIIQNLFPIFRLIIIRQLPFQIIQIFPPIYFRSCATFFFQLNLWIILSRLYSVFPPNTTRNIKVKGWFHSSLIIMFND